MKPMQSIAIADANGNFVKCVDEELPIYSITKLFIASAICSSGIDIDHNVSRWIDHKICPHGDNISVRMLLNHTSGLKDYGMLAEYAKAIESRVAPWSDEEFGNHTLLQPLLFEPGEGWAYSNPGYWLLSQILQKQLNSGFETIIHELVVDPLGLQSTSVVQGQFSEELPWYPAEWVWHGLMKSTASDIVRFLQSPLVQPLLDDPVRVPLEHPMWENPHYGLGAMIDPGIRYGHNGGGPLFSASCFHFVQSGLTGCVLMRSDREEEAMETLLREIQHS